MVNVNFICTYNPHSVIYCGLHDCPLLILHDYKTQPLNLTEEEEEEGGSRKKRGAEPIRAHSRMLIMQLQLFQLTCKLPIWTERERETREIQTDKQKECDTGRQSGFKHLVYKISEDKIKNSQISQSPDLFC